MRDAGCRWNRGLLCAGAEDVRRLAIRTDIVHSFIFIDTVIDTAPAYLLHALDLEREIGSMLSADCLS